MSDRDYKYMARFEACLFIALLLIAVILGSIQAASAGERSPQWPAVRDAYLTVHPACEACGVAGKEAKLNVHHVLPVQFYPEKELDSTNLITLCNKHHCHLMLGHLGDYRSFNPKVRADAAIHLEEIKARPYTKEDAAKFTERFKATLPEKRPANAQRETKYQNAL